MLTGLARTMAAASAMLAAGCSLTVDPDRVQCQVAADCAAIGYPDTDCVGAVCVSSQETAFACMDTAWPPLQPGNEVRIAILATTLGEEKPVPGLTVKICNTSIDPECTSPPGQGATNMDGIAPLDVDEGFRGHFFIDSIGPENAPYILHMNPPPNSAEPSTLQSGLVVTNLETIAGIAMLAGETFVPNRGHLFFAARGCDGELLPGVRVAVANAASDVVVAYLGTNGSPNTNLKSTGANARGAVINLQPGLVTVQGFRDDDVGKIFEQVLLVRENTITTTQIVPSTF